MEEITDDNNEEITKEAEIATENASSAEPTTTNESLSSLENWNEIVGKVIEKDMATGSFLRGSVCYYSEKNSRFYIVVQNAFTEKLLNGDKNKKSIFDAMLLCEADINSVGQIKIVVKKGDNILSDLDEFE